MISRTSVAQYKDRQRGICERSAETLGVAHVLEGSVQRVANKVRVNAQLIDARNDAHLWAQTYDRKIWLTCSQSKAKSRKRSPQQLQAHLSADEKAQIENRSRPIPSLTIFICEPATG